MKKGRHPGLSRLSTASLPLLASLLAVSLMATPIAGAAVRSTSLVGKQLAILLGSDTVSGDAFGVSVAVSGATAVVGAPGYAKDVGRVYVFSETTSGW